MALSHCGKDFLVIAKNDPGVATKVVVRITPNFKEFMKYIAEMKDIRSVPLRRYVPLVGKRFHGYLRAREDS